MEATEKDALTARQRSLYEFIRGYVVKNSYSPTLTEMANHLKISTAGVLCHVSALDRNGCIEWRKGIHRGVRIPLRLKKNSIDMEPNKSFTVGSVTVACIAANDDGTVRLEVIHPDTEELVS